MKKVVVLIATLDTKSEESKFAMELLKNKDLEVITIDVGTGLRGRPVFTPDYPAEEVAHAGGTTISELLEIGQTGQEMVIMEKMIVGASAIVGRLYAEGKVHGVFSLGGTMGTHMGTSVMRSLPFGVPKVMISTAASGDVRAWIGTKDIAMIPSVADIAGLNRISKLSLRRAAGALTGMVFSGEEPTSNTPLIAVTTLGSTTNSAMRFKKKLEDKGFEVVIFHAIGTGGKAMEELINEGKIQGVFDLSTNELIDHLYGGMTDAGPKRLEVAGALALPYLVAPGNLDHLLFNSPEHIPERFRDRKVHVHGPTVRLLRTRKQEMEEVGKIMAEKLNRAKGPTAVIFPLRGFSVANLLVKEEFDDPEADRLLLKTLKKTLRSDIKIIEYDIHINDEEFAHRAADIFLDLYQEKERPDHHPREVDFLTR
ncbi:MAG TPA: Tm-1-like ATP-binding domain-containing protein [Thermodesulfobacteriota bacterium]|nr:Tm-1-like ATP-binding domain-containing protein [Thermodesulfobacteriota bacterium]